MITNSRPSSANMRKKTRTKSPPLLCWDIYYAYYRKLISKEWPENGDGSVRKKEKSTDS